MQHIHRLTIHKIIERFPEVASFDYSLTAEDRATLSVVTDAVRDEVERLSDTDVPALYARLSNIKSKFTKDDPAVQNLAGLCRHAPNLQGSPCCAAWQIVHDYFPRG